MEHLNSYLEKKSGNPPLVETIQKTCKELYPKFSSPDFSFITHEKGLLFGEVQSGKTGQMFGLIAQAADNNFPYIILLTTDNTELQQQTRIRAQNELSSLSVCDERDERQFYEYKGKKPVLIVLKKNQSILRRWKNILVNSGVLAGNPLIIIDDEADAASLNTNINKKDKGTSTINKLLTDIENLAPSSIFLQVTGTPQALFLQTIESGFKPYFTYYFSPGKGYIGGNTLFGSKNTNPHIIFTDLTELDNILEFDDEESDTLLRETVITHLLTSAQLALEYNQKTSNCLIHPSVKTADHERFAEKVGNYLNDIREATQQEIESSFEESYKNLHKTHETLLPLPRLLEYIYEEILANDDLIQVLNSKTERTYDYLEGINFIIGGNTLGRGLTFPQLQTVYYSRTTKRPQADTMWQHARMFGYDRKLSLLRIYMPKTIYRNFQHINTCNNLLIEQVTNSKTDYIHIPINKAVSPTRRNVISNSIQTYIGGQNYFPSSPTNNDFVSLEMILKPFNDEYNLVHLDLIKEILTKIEHSSDIWNSNYFRNIIESLKQDTSQGVLIVRRNRKITQGTGTLLSPNDRKIGDKFPDVLVLTMYRIDDAKIRGWNANEIWVPNIKLPHKDKLYFLEDTP